MGVISWLWMSSYISVCTSLLLDDVGGVYFLVWAQMYLLCVGIPVVVL